MGRLVTVVTARGERDPSAAITWSRELMGVSKKLLVPSVIDAVIKKVNQKRITNSKDLRKLRTILPDPVARAHFLSEEGDIESAQLRLRPVQKKDNDGILTELEAAVEAMKNVPWTALQEMKGNPSVLKKIEDAEELLKSLRNVRLSMTANTEDQLPQRMHVAADRMLAPPGCALYPAVGADADSAQTVFLNSRSWWRGI